MKEIYRDEGGSVILLTLMIILAITLAGFAALNVTSVEFQVSRADRLSLRDFEHAEAGLNYAIGEFRQIYVNRNDSGNPIYTHSDTYTAAIKDILSSATNTTPIRDIHPSIAAVTLDYRLKDAGGNETGPVLARVEIRCLTINPWDTILSDQADSLPSLSHIGPPPEKYDKKEYCSRLFAITATAMDPNTGESTNTSVQGGVSYPENKDRFENWSVL